MKDIMDRISELERMFEDLGLDGSRYHPDQTCGSCGGVLEHDRAAICERCSLVLQVDLLADDNKKLREEIKRLKDILGRLCPKTWAVINNLRGRYE